MQQLLNPFAQKYPDAAEATLTSQASTVRFNPSGPFAGHYLAAGGADGLVEIWDVETRGVVRVLEGHVKTVSSVSWSRNNRYLLSASHDSTAIIWDLSYLPAALSQVTPYTSATSAPSQNQNGKVNGAGGGSLDSTRGSTSGPGPSTARFRTIRFDAPVARAEFHPRNSQVVLATLTCNEVVLVDLRSEGGKAGRWVLNPADTEEHDGDVDMENEKSHDPLTSAIWSPCGSRIYTGTTRGEVILFDPISRKVLQSLKIANSNIRQLAFDSSGQNLIVSSSDRALRTFQVSPLTGVLNPVHRFQDLVNRTSWNEIGFSGDSEYVMGGAGHKMAHNVFVWDKDTGTLVKVLEGPKEPLIDCDWHPTRPVIASVATSGDIHIWQTSSPDNWAAFAPGFEELEENVEYEEREDEFDIEDETELSRRKNREEDLQIDILSVPADYPKRPEPLLVAPPNLSTMDADVVKTAIESMARVKEWADAQPDGDWWKAFYISVDLGEQVDGDEERD